MFNYKSLIRVFMQTLLICFVLIGNVYAKEKQDMSIRYFNYWVNYGSTPPPTHGHEQLHFKVTGNSLYIYQGKPNSFYFRCRTDGSLNRRLAKLLSELDLTNWPMAEKKHWLFSWGFKTEDKVCRWKLDIAHEVQTPGEEPQRLSLSGEDDGRNPKRLVAESSLREFFLTEYAFWKTQTPRYLSTLNWTFSEEGKHSSLNLKKDKNGILYLSGKRHGKHFQMAVWPGLSQEVEAIINRHELDKEHGIKTDQETFSLKITFDTLEEIRISSHEPMSFRLAAAQKDLKEAIEPFLSMASLSPPGNLNFLHFNIFGMRHSTQIQLYERRDKEGPVLILRSSHGSGNDKGKECLIDATALSDLETLLEKYRLKEWDGFKGTPQPDVLDGESFYLKVGFRDASGIYATGENSFPEGFHAFQNALKTFVKKQFNDEE